MLIWLSLQRFIDKIIRWWKNRTSHLPPLPPRTSLSIRMEAIGGQGAHSAGKILAEAGVMGQHFTGNHFSSFGSEKRGSPVRSFVRLSLEGKPVRSAAFIQNPDILVIFHEALLKRAPDAFKGVNEQTDLLLHSDLNPEKLQLPLDQHARRIATVPAQRIAKEYNSGLNAVMLGALTRLCSEIDAAILEKTLAHHFQHLPAEQLQNNLHAFREAQKETLVADFSNKRNLIVNKANTDASSTATSTAAMQRLPRLGWLNAPIGGVIPHPGNTALRDNSVSRKGTVPHLLTDKCIHCGFCDMVCPDFCFVWDKDPQSMHRPRLLGIDYQYCKACEKCLRVCPVDALIPIAENELTIHEKNIHLFPELIAKGIHKGDSDGGA